nr:hypothetical protein [uncultured Oscillibacter sp.]
MNVNRSVQDTLSDVMEQQALLTAKLSAAMKAPILPGPAGPAGPTGAAGPAEGPTGPAGPTGPIIYTQLRKPLKIQGKTKEVIPLYNIFKQEANEPPVFLCPKGGPDHAGSHFVRLFLRR